MELFANENDLSLLDEAVETCGQLTTVADQVNPAVLESQGLTGNDNQVNAVVFVSIRTPATRADRVTDQLPSLKLLFKSVKLENLKTELFYETVMTEIENKKSKLFPCAQLEAANISYCLDDVRVGHMSYARQKFTTINAASHMITTVPMIEVKKEIKYVTYSVSFLLSVFSGSMEISTEAVTALEKELQQLDECTQTDPVGATATDTSTSLSDIDSDEDDVPVMDVQAPENASLKTPPTPAYNHCKEHKQWIERLVELNKKPHTFRKMQMFVLLARQIDNYLTLHKSDHPTTATTTTTTAARPQKPPQLSVKQPNRPRVFRGKENKVTEPPKPDLRARLQAKGQPQQLQQQQPWRRNKRPLIGQQQQQQQWQPQPMQPLPLQTWQPQQQLIFPPFNSRRFY